MFSTINIRRSAILLSVVFGVATPAGAQIAFTPQAGNSDPQGSVMCTYLGEVYLSGDSGECDSTGGSNPDTLTFHSGTELEVLSGATANFSGPVNFNSNNVQFNSSNVAFGGGSATFNNTVSFTGPSVTFSTGTTFQNPATFNGTTDFNAGMTTTNITNSGGISTSTLIASSGLTVGAGASVNMGGNQVHGVAAGTANTDAVNVAQLNAATSGITADVTALETVTATHTTQITELQSTTTNQATQITALQAADAALDTRVSALEIATGQIDTLFDLRRTDRRDMKQGVAAAMSMAQAPMPSGPGRISYAVNGATFRGEYAVGASLNYRLNTQAPMMVSVGASYAGNKNNGFRVGVAGEF
jgi:hypothetical protein